MQWSSDPNAGFSDAEKILRPVVARGPYGYQEVNVEDQLRRPDSLLRWLITMIRVRKRAPEIGAGRWSVLPVRRPSVLALRYDYDGSTVVTLHNFGERAEEISMALEPGSRLTSLLDDERSTGRIQLEPSGYRWFRVTG